VRVFPCILDSSISKRDVLKSSLPQSDSLGKHVQVEVFVRLGILAHPRGNNVDRVFLVGYIRAGYKSFRIGAAKVLAIILLFLAVIKTSVGKVVTYESNEVWAPMKQPAYTIRPRYRTKEYQGFDRKLTALCFCRLRILLFKAGYIESIYS
jgi:hypothetical protein